MTALKVYAESWPIRGSFTISRGSKTQADVVVVELQGNDTNGTAVIGRGECVPYARYNESVDSVIALIQSVADDIKQGMTRLELQSRLAPGAARNALDCAYWDLEAKQQHTTVWHLAGLSDCQPLETAYTLSLDTAENMHKAALANAHRPLLKLKLAGEGDLQRVEAVRAGISPNTRLIVDANEGWDESIYNQLVPALADLGVIMIEQPLPAGKDALLTQVDHPIAICADESCHGLDSLSDIQGKYDMINIKLDKTGGLTEALALKQAAEAEGLSIMIGCMLATSLAMAPAMVVGQGASIIDLDGPLLLDKDRDNGIQFSDTLMYAPNAKLWG